MPETTEAPSDIAERLTWAALHGSQEQALHVMGQARREIEQLRADLALLKRIAFEKQQKIAAVREAMRDALDG